ncbi:hypothetical protein ACFYO2_37130 [Streptomyces sp. NPDC006602]|uniref:hypothetical protein n=1 Tax=Streptomyces sp. NPDC006602 TaxID=3364751 RepID=UPI003680EA27
MTGRRLCSADGQSPEPITIDPAQTAPGFGLPATVTMLPIVEVRQGEQEEAQ